MGQPQQTSTRHVELIRVGKAEFLVELTDLGGPRTISADQAFSFDGIRDTIEAIASEMAQVWGKVCPQEATVEFGLSLTARAGKLTGLLVDAGGSGSLKICLSWKANAA